MLSGDRLFWSRLMRRNKMLVRTRRHRVTLSLRNYRARRRRPADFIDGIYCRHSMRVRPYPNHFLYTFGEFKIILYVDFFAYTYLI